jgi:hypothetical protein
VTERPVGPIEYATQPEPRGYTFPTEWGAPPIDWDERAAWILEHIEEGRRARAAGAEVRWLHTPSPSEAQAYLALHVESPALAAARRAAVLAATRLGPEP